MVIKKIPMFMRIWIKKGIPSLRDFRRKSWQSSSKLKYCWIAASLTLLAMTFTGCASVAGNVVPKSGPKMEQVYDSMQEDTSGVHLGTNGSEKLSEIRTEVSKQVPKPSDYDFKKYQKSALKEFKKLPNPELRLYVYPHFAGQEQVPVPGYFTGFDAYDKDFYEIKI